MTVLIAFLMIVFGIFNYWKTSSYFWAFIAMLGGALLTNM